MQAGENLSFQWASVARIREGIFSMIFQEILKIFKWTDIKVNIQSFILNEKT